VSIGKIKGWRGAMAVSTLAFAGLLSLSPVSSRACLFLQEFESSSKAGNRVSLIERVVYSLIQAKDRAERGNKQGSADGAANHPAQARRAL
jgi:hypothetical protein